MTSDGAIPAGEEYRASARRLRYALRDKPQRLYAELRDLARRHDALGKSTEAPVLPAAMGGGRAAWFAQSVAERLEGPVLRYSQRRRLIRSAERMGIGRFEANLIIAVVQHQAGHRPVEDRPPVGGRGIGAALVVAGVIQGAIIAAVWWLVAG